MHGIVLLTSTNQVQALAEQMLQEGIHKIDYAKRIHSIDVVGEARQAIETGANIIIARGYQAALIKDFTNVPIVEIRMTGQEMALLICQAVHMLNKKQPRLAVVGFSNMLCPIDNYGEIFDVRLSIYAISTYEEIGAVMDQLVREGVDLVIGIEEILESAAKLGIPSVLLATTKDSLQVAFDTAEQLLHAGNMEKENYAQIVSLLDYSFNGIIRTTPDGVITLMNQIMQELLGQRSDEVIGLHICDVMRDLDRGEVNRVLRGEIDSHSSFIALGSTALIVILAPVKIDGRVGGAFLSCHRTQNIQQLEASVVRGKYMQGFVAKGTFDDIMTISKKMQRVVSLAKKFSQPKRPILIIGEAGTEKVLLAESIHNYSMQKKGPFLAVTVTGLTNDEQMRLLFGDGRSPDKDSNHTGVLGAAQHGTILIHDIEKLSLFCQQQLYKSIQYQSYIRNDAEKINSMDIRVIAATTKPLESLVEQELFRDDLYYLISGLRLDIPPLRERPGDVDLLLTEYIRHFSSLYSRYYVLSEGARRVLLEYEWAGNRNQMESFCARLVLTATNRTIDEAFVRNLLEELYPVIYKENERARIVVYQNEEAMRIERMLDKYDGDRAHTANALGISKTTLWRHMKKYGIGSYRGINLHDE